MEKYFPLNILSKLPTWLFFLLLGIYQVLFIFQGFDLCDEGFYAVFYQQIFNDPASVQYNFMYWFSGVVGGSIVKLFPGAGMLGLRMMGVAVTTLTVFIAYRHFYRYADKQYLKLGLLLTLLMLTNDPKEIYHNNLSALFFVSSAALLFRGLKKDNNWLLVAAGGIVALNTFTRLTNVLNLSIGLVIFYYYYNSHRQHFLTALKKNAWFAGGFIMSCALILLIMRLSNQLQVFTDNLNLVASMGKSEEGSHSVGRILRITGWQYILAIVYAILVIGVLTVLGYLLTKILKSGLSRVMRFGWGIPLFLCFAVIVALSIYKGWFDRKILLLLVTGICLVGSAFVFRRNKDRDIGSLLLMGLCMLLFLPVGSDQGIDFVGRYSFWLLLPLLVSEILRSFRTNENEDLPFKFAAVVVTACIIVTGLYQSYFYPYFDLSNRVKMKYAIQHKYFRGIYTTRARAEAVNEFIKQSSLYIKKNDVVLAYNCIPMVHYLTDSRPYMRNSWPGIYDTDIFEKELQEAPIRTGTLPAAIIMQKVQPVATNWPEQTTDSTWLFYTPGKTAAMQKFIEDNHYNTVWENNVFKILIPQP